jgi:tRNA (Thr-GGU) A37 N-methylase
VQARKLLSEFLKLTVNNVSFSQHACEQMIERDLKTGDVLNVLRAGKIHVDPEFENETWRYRIETSKIIVVFVFNRPDKIRIVTAWRKL